MRKKLEPVRHLRVFARFVSQPTRLPSSLDRGSFIERRRKIVVGPFAEKVGKEGDSKGTRRRGKYRREFAFIREFCKLVSARQALSVFA